MPDDRGYVVKRRVGHVAVHKVAAHVINVREVVGRGQLCVEAASQSLAGQSLSGLVDRLFLEPFQ
mgnify:CR=1 FL=1